jgi:hypothetical protein
MNNMTALRNVRMTIKFLPGHTLADIVHVYEVTGCSPSSVREFHALVGTVSRKGFEYIRAEEF